MADGPDGPQVYPGVPADMMEQFAAAVAGTSPGDLHSVLRQLMVAAGPDIDPFARPAPPSRRRPRRPVVVTYRVRVDLKGTKPPLWRRLELSSDLLLDEVHQVIQRVFGWTDSHLHPFGSSHDLYSQETELYLCPYQVDEGETAGHLPHVFPALHFLQPQALAGPRPLAKIIHECLTASRKARCSSALSALLPVKSERGDPGEFASGSCSIVRGCFRLP